MKICITIIIFGLMIIGCEPKNTDFDPFDNEYRFHKNFRLADYDTINGECGYWNLTNRYDGTYYQFFIDETEIVAKGFYITVDEIDVKNLENDSIDKILKSVKNMSVDLNTIKPFLNRFGIKQAFLIPDSIHLDRVEMIHKSDSTYYATILPFLENDKIIRQISYFNGNDKLPLENSN